MQYRQCVYTSDISKEVKICNPSLDSVNLKEKHKKMFALFGVFVCALWVGGGDRKRKKIERILAVRSFF